MFARVPGKRPKPPGNLAIRQRHFSPLGRASRPRVCHVGKTAMKLREIIYSLGFKPKPRSYGYDLRQQMIRGATYRYAQWLHPRAYECRISERELDRLEQFLRPGDVAVDIGAHMGDSTLPMAVAVGSQGHVIALEANRFVFPCLEANARANPHVGRIHAFNLAATDENRMYEFSYNDPGFMNGGEVARTRGFRKWNAFRQQVQGVRLEDFLQQRFAELLPRLRYIKIDTEGCDLYVLQAIAGLLQRARPYVQAEVMKGTGDAYRLAMYDLMKSLGYAVYLYIDDYRYTTQLQRHEMLQHKNFDIFCIADQLGGAHG